MSDINAPIQIHSELNVPDTASDNETEQFESNKPISAVPTSANKTQSAEKNRQQQQLPKHRLRSDAKSQSMHSFPNLSKPIEEKEAHSAKQIRNEPPTITLSPASARYSGSGSGSGGRISSSLDRSIENQLMGDPIKNPSQMKTDEMQFNANRKRKSNSLPVPEHQIHCDDEFDELEPSNGGGSQLRIRSSIISLFGRMGKMRRTSSISQNSIHENGTGAEHNEHVSSLRNLPQIAATKILRAFSYVGKR